MFSFIITFTCLVFTLIHVIYYFVDLGNYQTAINSITISEVDLSEIRDGEYIGEYDAGFIYAKVKVTVNNHMITDVELLKHNHERGAKAEAIVENIVNEQKIDVDTISSATNSSKVIKKACLNALSK